MTRELFRLQVSPRQSAFLGKTRAAVRSRAIARNHVYSTTQDICARHVAHVLVTHGGDYMKTFQDCLSMSPSRTWSNDHNCSST